MGEGTEKMETYQNIDIQLQPRLAMVCDDYGMRSGERLTSLGAPSVNSYPLLVCTASSTSVVSTTPGRPAWLAYVLASVNRSVV
jgi:hypothetical protein